MDYINEKIQEAYEKTIIEPILEKRKIKKGKKAKKTPWRKLKQRLKALKRFRRKKAKKTKDAFNRNAFKKKGKGIKAKFKKLLKKFMKEEFIKEADNIDPRKRALAQHLGIAIADIEDEIEEMSYGGFEAEGGEWEVLTENEADERSKDYIADSIWAFNTWFIENHIDVEDANRYFGFEDSYYDEDEEEEVEIGDADEVFYMGMGMDLTEWIESKQAEAEGGNDDLYSLVQASSGIDVFVDNAIQADGRGHFLNHYDGAEHEEQVDGTWYNIYQTN